MTPGDIIGAVALSKRAGGDEGAEDWERLLYWSPEGCFVLDHPDEGIVGTIGTVTYGDELAWLGMLFVAPDRADQGLAQQLIRAALDHLIAREIKRIMLDSTEQARPLYRDMGFHTVCKIERWEGRASTYLGARARRMRPADYEAMLTLDRTLSGLDRSHVLMRLLDEFPHLAWADYERGELSGYLLGSSIEGAVHLGPWMSWDTAAAQRLLLTAFEQLQGRQIVMHIPDYNGRSLILASDHNLRRVRHYTRMIYGQAQPVVGDPLGEMAIISLVTG